jgi:hypothetical protein
VMVSSLSALPGIHAKCSAYFVKLTTTKKNIISFSAEARDPSFGLTLVLFHIQSFAPGLWSQYKTYEEALVESTKGEGYFSLRMHLPR